MDAIDFMTARVRMCNYYDKCEGCPVEYNPCGFCGGSHATHLVEVVESWAAAHPLKTRQSVFLEQYPEAHIGPDGVLQVCPVNISAAYRSSQGGCYDVNIPCSLCRKEFWLKEV